MSAFVLVLITGIGLAAVYFLISAGLSLVYGLMHVLNFAHGAMLTLGAYASWALTTTVGYDSAIGGWIIPIAILFGMAVGAASGAIIELVFIRPLYGNHTSQILITIGLALVILALCNGIWGSNPLPFPPPTWINGSFSILGASVPTFRLVLVALSLAVLLGLVLLLKRTRVGLIIRAGVENRTMVRALGIDVRQTFFFVFVLAGALAALGGVLAAMFQSSISPVLGTELMLYAFIVVIIGGVGSLTGTALAALLVGLVQQFANYYLAPGFGDVSVIALLAVVLLTGTQGLSFLRKAS